MTRQRGKQLSGHEVVGLMMLAWAVAVCGCSALSLEPSPAQEEIAAEPVLPPPPPEPRLEAASDAHLTLFGEFPDRARIPFQARAASPMEQHTFTIEGADFDVDLAPDAQWMVFSSTRHTSRPDLYLKTVDGRAVTQLTSDPAADVQPCFSPDGKSVAFASDRSGNWDLWIIGLEGGQCRQITRSPMHEVHPSFAPDGKRLAYCAFNPRADQWELWTLQFDQPGSKKMIGIGLFPEWSPVADSIVYQKARQRGGRWFSIWRVDLQMGEPKFPVELAASAEHAFIQPSWSADGQWVAYGTAVLGAGADARESPVPVLSHGDVWIMRADGTSLLQLTDGAGAHFGPVFSTDQRVYFTSLQNGAENVWSVKPLLVPITQAPVASDDAPAGKPAWEVATPRSREPNQGG